MASRSSTPLIAAGAVGALVGALLMARSRRPGAAAGGDEDAAPSSMELLKRFVEVFGRGDREAAIAFAPGRANLIGEHTDYAEGFVFPFGINKHVYVVFRPRADTKLRVYAADLGEWGEIDLADVARARAADAGYGPQIQPEFLRYCVGPFEWMRATRAGADARALFGFERRARALPRRPLAMKPRPAPSLPASTRTSRRPCRAAAASRRARRSRSRAPSPRAGATRSSRSGSAPTARTRSRWSRARVRRRAPRAPRRGAPAFARARARRARGLD